MYSGARPRGCQGGAAQILPGGAGWSPAEVAYRLTGHAGSVLTGGEMPRPHVEEERRQQILEATWHVIAVSGFRSLRLSDVAKRAGISSGMIHYYFDTKRDLLKAAFERYYEHSMQRRQWIMETGKGPLELLKLLVESYLPIEDETLEGWRVWR